jgi:subtilisin-like proprotein convertase family protein
MLVMAGSLCRGGLIIETFTPNAPIPAGNPVGQTFVGTVSDFSAGSLVTSLTLELNVGGGYNGSFVISLQAPNGTSVSLLNRPGATGGNPFGYGGSGLNLTLSDAGATGIQSTPETPGAVVTGTYQAAGSLATLYGSAANGNWMLYFADVNAGGGSPTLNSFSLDITAVPEPVNLALGMFAAAGLLLQGVRRRQRRKQVV